VQTDHEFAHASTTWHDAAIIVDSASLIVIVELLQQLLQTP
jgi:hypothetical protein